jgi:hypothetical protein
MDFYFRSLSCTNLTFIAGINIDDGFLAHTPLQGNLTLRLLGDLA